MSHPYFPVPTDICRAKKINQVASQRNWVEGWKDPVLNLRGVTMQKGLTLASIQQQGFSCERNRGEDTEPTLLESPAFGLVCYLGLASGSVASKNSSLRNKRSKNLDCSHCFLAHTITLPLGFCRFCTPSPLVKSCPHSCPRDPSPSTTAALDFCLYPLYSVSLGLGALGTLRN